MLLDAPHHDGSPLYVTGEARLGATMTVRLRVPHASRTEQVSLRCIRDGEPHVVAARVESTDVDGVWWAAPLLLHNPVVNYRFLLHGPGRYSWVNGSGEHHRDVPDAHDFRISTHPGVPDWVRDGVVYQVFPDRFARSGANPATPPWAEPAAWDDAVIHDGPASERQWFGGDLAGVEQHLDHLVDLGATVLYLTPVFEAGTAHRYDAVTFDRVAPELGGDEAFASLTKAAHARGLRVVGDLTTNHTGIGHEWFTRAAADPDADEAGWFRFREHPHDVVTWLDVPHLPKLDHSAPGLRAALRSVVERWLRDPVALDGWRIDVANMTGREGPQDRNAEVARTVREAMAQVERDTDRPLWLLAEHGHDASLDLPGDGWHSVMNYAGFTRPVWTWLTEPGHGLTLLGLPLEIPSLPGPAAVETMRDFGASVPWSVWSAHANLLGSHDTPRIRTVVGRAHHRIALALLTTLPGVPTIFAGDEIGLTATNGEHARTPFPWQRRQEWDADTLLDYRRWIALRREHVALRRGGLRWAAVHGDSMTFLREHPDETLLVHVARAPHPPVRLPLSGAVHTLAGADAVRDGGDIVLPSDGPAAHLYRVGP